MARTWRSEIEGMAKPFRGIKSISIGRFNDLGGLVPSLLTMSCRH